MTRRDVLRGVFRAYLWSLGLLCLYFIAVAVTSNVLGMAAIWAVYAALFGVVFSLPAGLLALAVHYALRQLQWKAKAWMPPVLSAALILVLLKALDLAIEPNIFVAGSIAGLITGIAFWHGAAGWRWSVDLLPDGSANHPSQ